MGDPLLSVLDATGVEYEIVACDPALADTAEFCATYGYRLDQPANTILVIGKSKLRCLRPASCWRPPASM